jgi:hypothetical protein
VDVASFTEAELRQEILKLRQRVETRGAAPVGPRPVANLRVPALKRTSAGGRSQAADPARRESGWRVYPVTSGPAVPASVPESVSGLASTADGVCARRSVVLPADRIASTDVCRSRRDQGHGHRSRVPSRPDRHARRSRPVAQHRVSVAVDLVPPRSDVRLAPPAAADPSGEAEGGAAHERT